MVWLFLLFLGITLYFIVQQSVVRVTRTPWWQLWLALMIPAFVIAGWTLTHRPVEAMPTPLLVGSFIVSVVIYMALLGANPRTMPPDAQPPTDTTTPAESTSPLSQAEQAQLQTCFPWSVYYLQQIDLRPQAVICRGQLRKTPEEAYHTIRQNIQAQFGDRFLVLLQSGAMNQPFFALVTNPYEDSQKQRFKTLNRPVLALSLFLSTLVTTTLTGLSLDSPTLKPETLSANPSLLLNGLPYAIALMLILGIHELGHYFTAQFYKIRTTLPYFIPVPFAFGTFGAYIQMRSPVPNRKALFDVGIAGPLMGLVITLP
ncbi:MAG: site-2 protease family protein, partial [Thermosynechococcaceae cyanobacterium]